MSKALKVVMAQVNLLVGDIEGNTAIVLANAKRAVEELGADIVAFPELTLTGYPPEDLLLRPSLPLRIEKALAAIASAKLPIYIVVGFPLCEDGLLYNAVSVCYLGQQLALYRKQALPNYQVFDERRYFVAGDRPCVVNIKGYEIGLTICEDLWEDQPTEQAKAAGAQLLININASPFDDGKIAERAELIKKRARAHNLPIVYVNLVGGQDELVFDGNSTACNADGSEVMRSPMCEESLQAIEFVPDDKGLLAAVCDKNLCHAGKESQLYDALVLGVKDYVNKNGFKGIVLGLSGGIDSALTLAIAVDALGKDRVEAVMMPFEYTSKLSLDAAAEQAQTLGVNYKVIPIAECYNAFTQALSEEFAGLDRDVTEQNIQARCRGVLLMAISNKKAVLVLTTGNKSEIAVGYSTLYGDMAGGFDVLKDVSKTLVYKLSDYRNNGYENTAREVIPQRVIDRPPSAELAPGQVDQDSLPPYEVLDQILELYIENDCSAQAIISQGFSTADVNRVLSLVDLNEYKRRQSPVGVRLTRRGFGRDRRYPITNGWPLGE